MQDKLKEYVDSSREDFDMFDFPQEDSWKAISNHLQEPGEVKMLTRYWKYAVAACLMVVTGFSAYFLGQMQPKSGVLSELQEIENYYQGEIDMKMSLVKQRVNDPVLIADLESMDQAFSELKNDLKDNVDNAEVVEAMMENYQLKLRILEKVLHEINENEKGKDDSAVRL
ncbi:MAG: hypothetical protein ABJN36_03950 [Cyclobacteriaceae bacterium]